MEATNKVTRENLKKGNKLKRKFDNSLCLLTCIEKIEIEDDVFYKPEEKTKADYLYHFKGFTVKGGKLLSKMFEKTLSGELITY